HYLEKELEIQVFQTPPKPQRRHSTYNTKQKNGTTSKKTIRSNTVPSDKYSHSNTAPSDPLQTSPPATQDVNAALYMSPSKTAHEFKENILTQPSGKKYVDITSQMNHGTNPIASNTLPNKTKYTIPINSIDSYNSNHNISTPYLHTSELATSHDNTNYAPIYLYFDNISSFDNVSGNSDEMPYQIFGVYNTAERM
ncbi:11048_t:CDS:2, partial [Dentiscutata heterogama]